MEVDRGRSWWERGHATQLWGQLVGKAQAWGEDRKRERKKRQRDRQADRQTDRQTDRQADRQAIF